MNVAPIQRNGRFFDSLHAADICEVDALQGLAGSGFVNRAECCLHDAARCSEDGACPGTGTERAVKLRFRKLFKVKTDVFDQFDKLACREDKVCILHAVAAEFRTCGFEFLGRAGHDGNGDEILDVDAYFLWVVGLCNGTEDGHRAFRRREVVSLVAKMFFHEVDPAWTAGGNHRERTAVLQAVKEFCTLFHDGEVGTEIRIKDLIKTEHLERGNHFPRDDFARLSAKGIAERNADGRSNLNEGVFLWIAQCVKNAIGVVFFNNGTDRADKAALSTEDAVRRFHWFIVCRRHADIRRAAGKAESFNALYIFAGADAAATANAFRRIADNRGICHDFFLWLTDGRKF